MCVLDRVLGKKLSVMEGCHKSSPIVGRAANHFELAFTASEFLLDFGQAYGESGDPVIHTRIIVTPIAARALSQMLQQITEHFDQKWGPKDDRHD